MTLTMRNSLLCVSIVALSFLASGCEKLRARDHLNKGVQAFKSAKYSDADELFKTAVDLDPSFEMPRLYLATAYMQQYIPGAESPENIEVAQKANDEFQKVLQMDPKNKLAIESMASLRYNQAQGITDLSKKLAKLDEDRIGGHIDLRAPDGTYIELEPVDIYQKPDDTGHKQTTFRITITDPKRTLTDKEVNAVLDASAAGAKTKFNAERI